MDFELTDEQRAWREEVRSFLRDHLDEETRREIWEHTRESRGPKVREFLDKVAERGWYGLSWPEEYGGLDKSAMQQFLLSEEFSYHRAPHLPNGVTMLGPTIIRHGSEEDKERWLPRIINGEVEFALGYSEPEAGTDLANLRTRAELEGDRWVVNGQKIWNSAAHLSSHVWLAARTDPDAPKHEGISIIVVPLDAEGVEIQPIYTWADDRINQIYFDDVTVPEEYLVGEVNAGWRYIVDALDFERVYMGESGDLRRLHDELVQWTRETTVDGRTLVNKPRVQRKLAELEMDLEIAFLFGLRTAWLIDQGEVPNMEGSMAKVFTTELRTKLSDWAGEIADRYTLLDRHDPAAPLNGDIEFTYRYAPFLRFGGGANEVLRNIIAQRGLGLPRV